MACKAIGTAFALQPGEQATVIDNNGVLVLELVSSNESDPLEDEAIAAQRKNRQRQSDLQQPQAIFQCLEELAQIKDYRHHFY